ncbi:MAG: P1 family peptidase [Saprospiraceae bacterium]|nr:P1 family peptidase [Saprospiraceae bacterium]
MTARDLGLSPGVLPIGETNSITDVPGVLVGHLTKVRGDSVCTGVTAILPHGGNLFQSKVPAAIFIGNGFGKLAGSSQVEELGNLETPIILTNTLNVATAISTVVQYTLGQPGNENVRSVNAVVGETNDGRLNDIRGMHVTPEDVLKAITGAGTTFDQGSVGAGTGTIAFGYKGGIGTASRRLPERLGGYTLGVLVQSNFGGVLKIDGVPVGKELETFPFKESLEKGDGSCMIIIATDAPVDSRNLKRIAKRGMLGLARTGGFASNGSGDYVIAFSTAEVNFVPYEPAMRTLSQTYLHNDHMSALFLAAVESTEEAIINSLMMATIPRGFSGRGVEVLPLDKITAILKKYNRLK